ncbi:MAG: hypothetical protein NPIRA04_29230 [Nitrospirales bacterium]|nr:MAG: hypothetical protein NPIRA04_29230 [Nitrospirales bacterium]
MEVTELVDRHVLHPEGDLTIFEAAEFREALLMLSKHEGPLELNVSGVERVDSSGIQLMIAASHDGRLAITGMTDSLRDKIAGIGCAHLVKDYEK